MLILIILALLIALFLFLIFPAVRRHPDREIMRGLYIAHRGLHQNESGVPENSMAAFRRAIERGIAIETDIHLTKDGEIVIFHDDNLKRLCGVDAVIETKTLSELKGLRLLDTDEQIPTLKEFLELVDGRVPLLIEFKTKSLKTCNPLCSKANEILSRYSGKYFVQSFFPFVGQWYKKRRKDILRGQLSSGYFKEKGVAMRLLSCLLINFISRPDFVAYETKYYNNFFRRVAVLLGAHSAGWTFSSQNEVNELEKEFSTKIFEGFIPKE